jgi:DNA-binding PadR family transcriptional regulator
MKRRGFVKDQWVWFAPNVVPGIKAHTWAITNQGRKEFELLQSIREPAESHPLGYRILLFMSHGGLMTIGQVVKTVGKDRGHVKRVMQSLQNKGFVDCLRSKTRTSLGHDMITHLYRINDLGRQVLDADPEAYLREVRRSSRTSNWHYSDFE